MKNKLKMELLSKKAVSVLVCLGENGDCPLFVSVIGKNTLRFIYFLRFLSYQVCRIPVDLFLG